MREMFWGFFLNFGALVLMKNQFKYLKNFLKKLALPKKASKMKEVRYNFWTFVDIPFEKNFRTF